jgi:5-methyltetrahydropteroyltriglutamate--homocysteine methyltransferase
MLTTVIGSYPKPSFLKLPDWFTAKGGTDTKHPTEDYNNAIKSMGDKAESIFLKATKEVIEDQIECGIDIVTDGEVRRENYIHYHCRHLEGIDFNKLTKKIARTGNYECWLPTITNKVEAKDSFLVHDWSVAQNISSQPVKITMPGPMTITDTIANDYYTSVKELGEDLAKAINLELNRLVDAGCKYIQVDEPLFARKPREAIEYGVENLEKCFDGISNPDVEKITHICCGYPDKLDAVDYPKAPLDSYQQIAKLLDKSIIDSISIEDAHRNNNLDLLEKFDTKTIILGVVKIASSEIESEEKINQRVNQALDYIDKKRLILAPDCGLGFLPQELCLRKLRIMTKVAKSF